MASGGNARVFDAIAAKEITVTNIHLVPQAAPPASPVEGDIYADTDHTLNYYNGTSWINMLTQ